MKQNVIVALATACVMTTVLGAGVWFLGTFNLRAHTEKSQMHREVSNVGAGTYFSSDYRTARDRFLSAAGEADLDVESLQNPHQGPDGQPLFTDVAVIGPNTARSVLVLSSGTHGVEGFAGSGIQTGLLQEGVASRLRPGVRLVMIHGINPYGMAHLRRANEGNVDLNRNFRDYAVPHSGNHGYERLANVVAPQSMSFWSEVAAWSRLLWFRLTAGTKASQAALQGGQYSYPDGLFYGGTEATSSNQTVRWIARRHLSDADHVVMVDVHTGLGGFGNAELILNDAVTAPNYQRALAIWGPKQVRSTISGESVSGHVDASLKRAFADMLPEVEVTAVSLEFGTVPPMEAFKALRAENWLHHHAGPNHPRAIEIKTRLLRAFHPEANEWKASVWNQGKAVVEQALDFLSGAESQ
jgi:hypothetical protein